MDKLSHSTQVTRPPTWKDYLNVMDMIVSGVKDETICEFYKDHPIILNSFLNRISTHQLYEPRIPYTLLTGFCFKTQTLSYLEDISNSNDINAVFKAKSTIFKEYGNNAFSDFANILQVLENREKQLYRTHHVFYHASTTLFKFLYDIYRFAACIQNQQPISTRSRVFRLETTTMGDFMRNVYNNEIENIDHTPEYKRYCISANLSLYGGNGPLPYPGESSLDYYVQNINNTKPEFVKENIKHILDKYSQGIEIDWFVNILFTIFENYVNKNPHGVIYQIFVEPSVVNDIAYISTPYGYRVDCDVNSYLNFYKNNPGVAKKLSSQISGGKSKYYHDYFEMSSSLQYHQARLVYNERIFLSDNVLVFEADELDPKYEKTLISTIALFMGYISAHQRKQCIIL